jgi:large subunit ribosomal protein L7Ae
MPAKKGAKKVAPAPKIAQPKAPAKPAPNPLFEKRARNYGIGQSIQPKRDLTRFVKWPKYIKLQRQRRVLLHRLKVPPTINQFTHTLDKNTALQLFRLLNKYKPETPKEKKQRLFATAQKSAEKTEKTEKTPKPLVVKFGINHVTGLIEQKKAKLVVIAHDVDPVELVVWMPTLCRKLDIPYVIVKGKARIGTLVNKKTATVACLTDTRKEDKNELANLAQVAKDLYNNNTEIRRTWGGGKLGGKSMAVVRRREKALAKEQAFREAKA